MTVKNNEYYFELFESVNSYNGTLKYYEAYTEIGAIQTDKLLDILYSWFDCLNNSLSIDHKMIDLVGGIFREVEGFDRLLLHDFLVKESNEVTLSLLSAFLEGYWSATHTVDKEAVSQLEKLFNNLDSTSPGFSPVLSALCLVADPLIELNLDELYRDVLRDRLIEKENFILKVNLDNYTKQIFMLLYDAEARKFYNIFDHAKNKTPQKLKNIDFQALKPHLFNWLDIWSKPGFLDEDRLFDCRCLIEESYNINLSLSISEWLQQKNTTERKAVASVFLGKN